MKVKTSELIGAALDYAVAKCEYPALDWEHSKFKGPGRDYNPSLTWELGGPIIEREGISTKYLTIVDACCRWYATQKPSIKQPKPKGIYGPTPLIAAMRCYVASKLGEEIEIPEELI